MTPQLTRENNVYGIVDNKVKKLFFCLSVRFLHALFLPRIFCLFLPLSLPSTNTQPEACCGPKIVRKKSGKR